MRLQPTGEIMLNENIDLLLQDNWAWQELENEVERMERSPYVRSTQIAERCATMTYIARISAQYDGYLFH